MSVKINKNGKEYDLGFIPEHYPADRVYRDGNKEKSLQIKTKTLTNPTCASNGAIETDLTSDKIIVSVFSDIQVARVYLGGVYDGKYYLQSANFSSGSINKSTTLNGTVTIQYFD